MDNNNNMPNNPPMPDATPMPPAAQPVGPAVTQTPPMQPEPPKQGGGNKAIIGMVIFILLVAGAVAYFALFAQKGSVNSNQVKTIPTLAPTNTPTPTPTANEQEVQNVDIQETTPTEMPQVEKDIQSL